MSKEIRFVPLLILLLSVPLSAQAASVSMAPDPLGDWIATAGALRTADVTLESGETTPTPTLVLRTTVNGTVEAGSTVNFNFHFDQPVSTASFFVVSGSFGAVLVVDGTAGGDKLLSYSCLQQTGDCAVDVTFEFATPPATVDVTDNINQFSESPGAPAQTLSASFSAAPSPVHSLGLGAIFILVSGLLVSTHAGHRSRWDASRGR